MRYHRARKVDAWLAREVDRHVDVHTMICGHRPLRGLARQIATCHRMHIRAFVRGDWMVVGNEPVGEQIDLPLLCGADMRAAEVEHRRVGIASRLALKDVACVERAHVMREHTPREVEIRVARQLERHRGVHDHCGLCVRDGRRRGQITTAHKHWRAVEQHPPACCEVS